MLKITLKRILVFLGFRFFKVNIWEKIFFSEADLLKKVSEYKFDINIASKVKGVVFSCDRPIQLHALLSSYLELVRPAVPLIVLVSISNESFRAAYEGVFKHFANSDIEFIIESDFRNDLIIILDQLRSERVFFLVDDIIFVKPVNLDLITGFSPLEYIPSLRLGGNIKYCYTSSVSQRMPQKIRRDNDFIIWDWKEGGFDWGYPVSVDGNIFLLKEIIAIAKILTYTAPNSFEGALFKAKVLFLNKKGVCYSTSRLVNIPLNKVQKENDNVSARGSVIYLLDLWNQGFFIDYKKIYGIDNVSPHQEIKVDFVKKAAVS